MFFCLSEQEKGNRMTSPNASPGPLISWESGIDMFSKGKLESMGFQFGDKAHIIGNVQAIQINPKTKELYGAADSSREGTAIGINQ